MYEPRLFESHGVVERLTITAERRPQGWTILVQVRREGDGLHWDREDYEALSWAEFLDVLTATALS